MPVSICHAIVVDGADGADHAQADELKMLPATRRLGKERGNRVRTGYLAAHAVPPECKRQADAYIDDVVLPDVEESEPVKEMPRPF